MRVIEGDLLQSVKYGVILQQVNAQNKMGSGFAKAVYEKYPAVKKAYHEYFELFPLDQGTRALGQIQVIPVSEGLWVLNIVGQEFFGKDGKRYTSYDALDDGLSMVGEWLRTMNLPATKVHHPLLGCGLGGGHWPVVEALIEHRLGSNTTLWLHPTA